MSRSRWLGPFRNLKVLSPLTEELNLLISIQAHSVFKVAALKASHAGRQGGRKQEVPPPPFIDSDGCKAQRKIISFENWKGYHEPIWESSQNLLDENGNGKKAQLYP